MLSFIFKFFKMTEHTPKENLLTEGGTVIYYGHILSPEDAHQYFKRLFETLDWQQDELIIFGKRHITKRKTAWYGDESFSYTYSNTTKKALPWTKELMELKLLVEKTSGYTFNSCLLNLYHSGEEGMSWHSDNEKELGRHPVIASLSLGAERKFSLKHREKKNTVSILLERGSLLLMKDATQENWVHAMPKTKKVKEARINLTFRNIVKG